MRYPWLDELEKNGTISKEACEEIYRDCSLLIKTGGIGNVATGASDDVARVIKKLDRYLSRNLAAGDKVEKMREGMPEILKSLDDNLGKYVLPYLPPMLIGGAVAGTMGVIDKRRHMKDLEKTVDDLSETRQAILSDPDLSKSKGKAEARFKEITAVAPSVARNKKFMLPFVKSKLNNGLDENDLERLALLQANYTSMPDQLRLGEMIDKKEGMPKLSSAKLGENMADCYFIVKEATAQDAIKGGLGRALLGILAMSSIPILGGLGVGAFKEVMNRKNKKDMALAHESSFSQAMKLSDPDKEPLHANKSKAEAAFKTLAHFAPNVAVEPQAAKAFMNKLVSYDMGINVGDVKDLSEIEKNIGYAKKDSPFISGFATGTKDLGLSKVVGDTVGTVSKKSLEPIGDMIGANL